MVFMERNIYVLTGTSALCTLFLTSCNIARQIVLIASGKQNTLPVSVYTANAVLVQLSLEKTSIHTIKFWQKIVHGVDGNELSCRTPDSWIEAAYLAQHLLVLQESAIRNVRCVMIVDGFQR